MRNVCKKGHIKWTLHALKRIRERRISSVAAIDTIVNGEIVAFYDDDKPLPSWLIYNADSVSPLHVVASTDGDKTYIITAYIPTSDEWESDFLTRKE